MERYLLKPPVPLRALALAAAAILVGAFLVVLGSIFSWPLVFTVIGAVLIVVGVCLGIFSVITPSRLTVEVSTDDDGYRITAGRRSAGGRWNEIVRAVQSDTGARITLERRDGTEHHIIAPGLVSRNTLDALAGDIRDRLGAR